MYPYTNYSVLCAISYHPICICYWKPTTLAHPSHSHAFFSHLIFILVIETISMFCQGQSNIIKSNKQRTEDPDSPKRNVSIPSLGEMPRFTMWGPGSDGLMMMLERVTLPSKRVVRRTQQGVCAVALHRPPLKETSTWQGSSCIFYPWCFLSPATPCIYKQWKTCCFNTAYVFVCPALHCIDEIEFLPISTFWMH
jgi:hypothetical protein